MEQPVWSYSVRHDGIVWKLALVGAAGAVPAAVLLPVALRIASKSLDDSGEGAILAALFLLPVALLSLWALLWWAAAGRRVTRLRRLARIGTQVKATVRRVRHLRGKMGVEGAVVWLEYEVGGRTYQAKRRTAVREIAWRAKENSPLEMVIDPSAPQVVAFVHEGKLS